MENESLGQISPAKNHVLNVFPETRTEMRHSCLFFKILFLPNKPKTCRWCLTNIQNIYVSLSVPQSRFPINEKTSEKRFEMKSPMGDLNFLFLWEKLRFEKENKITKSVLINSETVTKEFLVPAQLHHVSQFSNEAKVQGTIVAVNTKHSNDGTTQK